MKLKLVYVILGLEKRDNEKERREGEKECVMQKREK